MSHPTSHGQALATCPQARYAIVVAGGKGLRMGSDLPKQFILIQGRPVLLHTLALFATCQQTVLVLPESHISYWQELCSQYTDVSPHHIVLGGETRYHSVRNALDYLAGKEGLVAVHDGVRPLASTALIERCFTQAEHTGNAIPAIPLVDSIRHCTGTQSVAVDRSQYLCVQTPQVFDLPQLQQAYAHGYQEHYTDDASVYEAHCSPPITLVEGEERNIKLTRAQDLILAEYYLEH